MVQNFEIENVSAVVEHKNTEKTIYFTQDLYWVDGVGVVKSVEKKKSVAVQFADLNCSQV